MVAQHRLAQCFVRALALRHVAHDQAERRLVEPGFVRHVERSDETAAPESHAVRAQEPPLVEAPAIAPRFVDAIEDAFARQPALGIEQRVRSPDAGRRVETGDPADAFVPGLQPPVSIERCQRVIGDAGNDGFDPRLALAQRAVALHRDGDVVQDRHQPGAVELEQRQRKDLRYAALRPTRVDVQVQVLADLAVRLGIRLCPMAQVGADVAERLEEVGQFAVAGERHQQLRRHRVDHHDLTVDRRLHEADRRHVEKLRQRLGVARDGFGAVDHC